MFFVRAALVAARYRIIYFNIWRFLIFGIQVGKILSKKHRKTKAKTGFILSEYSNLES